MRYTGPKTRLARRVGEALREKDVKYLVKRNYPPGMHGQKRIRLSEYGMQLQEKQKARWTYQIGERQFRRYIQEASRKKGITPELLLELLETRLDNVVYRLGFAKSREQARQLVSHRFFTVNGRGVNIPSYKLSSGDEVAIAEKKKNSKIVQLLSLGLKDYKPLEWLELDGKSLSGRLISRPTLDNTGSTLRLELIVEHYSR